MVARSKSGRESGKKILESGLRRLWEFSRINNVAKMDIGFSPARNASAAGNDVRNDARDDARPRQAFLRATLDTLIFPVMLVGAMSVVLVAAIRYTSLEFNSVLYLIPVMISAIRRGVMPAMVAALASVAVSDFFFIPPFYSFSVSDPHQVVNLALFLFVALVTGNLAARLQREADSSRRREHEVHNLYLLSRRLALCSTASDLVGAIQEYLTSHLGRQAFLIRPPHENAESDMPIDGVFMSTRLRAEAAEMVAAQDARSRLVFDPDLQNLWALKSITTQTTDHGVLAVNLGNQSRRETGQLNDRIEAILSEAAATLMRIDAVTAFANANLRLQSDFLKTALIGSVSHQLRSPIASILGSTSVLDGIPALRNDRRVRSLVDGMHREARRLDNDIQNLLDTVRITDTGIKPVMEWTDPGDVITAAIRQRSHRLGGHKLEVDVAEGLPLLKVDSGLVEQAVGQVIENAGKYSPVDSTIAIKAAADAGELIVTVTDEGMGLMPDEAAQMFKQAFRGRRQLGAIPGLGLGLWIARIFIAANGGSIAARSLGPGRGTTVTIRFPVNADANANASNHAQIN
jgi:K+-sensing histidine kinase KdpD